MTRMPKRALLLTSFWVMVVWATREPGMLPVRTSMPSIFDSATILFFTWYV